MIFKNPSHVSGKSILRQQTLGFSSLLVLTWLVEILRIPHHFFGESPDFNLSRVAARTAILVVIWLIVHLTTQRLLKRLHELEDYLLICSWCRKVGHDDQWLTLERYFDSKFSTGTSHGICPECAEKQYEEHRAALRCESVEKSERKP